MVHLEKIDEENFDEVLKLKVAESQKHFVAPNVVSLAQAWVCYEQTFPYAIYNDENLVGFIMLNKDDDEHSVAIWRFMIGEEHQKKGYGRQALLQVINLVKGYEQTDFLVLDYVPENVIAKKLYHDLGFRETGEVDDGEIVMILPIVSKPRLGKLTCDKYDIEDSRSFIQKCRGQGLSVDTGFENMEEAIEQKKAIRYTIFGQTVGLEVEGCRLYSQRMVEILG